VTGLSQGGAGSASGFDPAQQPAPQRRSRRGRWIVAIGVVLIVALVSVAGVFVLSGAGGAAKSLTAGNAPQETLIFVDLRTDLPGDQHQKLADFLTHFPGFKDRALFDNAFDELLNRITSEISPQLTYTSAFKAWTSGEVSIAVTDLGLISGLDLAPAPQGALIVSLKDRARAEEWVASEAAKTGLDFVPSQYAGTTIFEAGSAQDRVAYAFTDRVFIAGNDEAVRAGLDAPLAGSLAEDADYQEAMESLGGDRVASFFVDPRAALRTEAGSLAEALGPFGGLVDVSSLDFDALPVWVAGSVRAESDRMTVEMKIPKPTASPTSGSRVSALAGRLPGSTVAVVELRAANEIAAGALGVAEGQPDLAAQVMDALKAIGGLDWIGDAALVVTAGDSGYGGGIVVQTPDAETAAGKKTLFANLGVLANAALIPNGLSVAASEWTYRGTSIARLTISGESIGSVDVHVAARDDLLIAGYGEDFMKAMLDTTERTSLAANNDYRTAMDYAGAANSGSAYVDIAAVVDDLGRAAFSSDPGAYDLNIAPYLENLGSLGCSVIDGQTVILRLVVVAK
jgi:hypothetical protein